MTTIRKPKFSLPTIFVERHPQRAGGSVWYERRLRKAEVAGSNPARSTPIWGQVLYNSWIILLVMSSRAKGKLVEIGS